MLSDEWTIKRAHIVPCRQTNARSHRQPVEPLRNRTSREGRIRSGRGLDILGTRARRVLRNQITIPRLASMFRSDKVSKLLKCFDGKMNVETYIDYPLRGALIS